MTLLYADYIQFQLKSKLTIHIIYTDTNLPLKHVWISNLVIKFSCWQFVENAVPEDTKQTNQKESKAANIKK